MRNVRRAVRIVVFLIVGLFLHYVLPQQDVARIVNVESRIQKISGMQSLFYAQEDAGTANNDLGRDLRLISTQRVPTYLFGLIRGGEPEIMVYRNEDTGWIYPPYFKFDSSDLQAEAAATVSATEPYQWVVITHYGWRIRWATIYPNAVSIREAPGPDYRPFPWVNLIIYLVLIAIFLTIRSMWRQFRERTVDPLTDKMGDQLDHVSADMAERRGRIRRWLDSWKSK